VNFSYRVVFSFATWTAAVTDFSAKPALAKRGADCYFSSTMNLFANKRVEYVLTELGQIAVLTKEVIASALTFKVAWRDLLYQIYFIGVKSQSVVLVTGAFTGMVLSAQTYFQFHKIKMDTASLAVVSVSMCSELGPVLTSLMVAGRVGAAIAAEIGTMRVTEQIDAVAMGLVKAFIYGGIIALIGCYKGLTCGLGAEGVGRATTEAVVYSSITILIMNFFLTLFMGKLVGQL
jgi:ABC-type transporter Mla maintaining outer membrane lipid asymmetry permease subunit MlaE